MIKHNKKAQTWTTDFFMSVILFTTALIIISRAMIDAQNMEQRGSKLQLDEAEQIGNILMAEGQPQNWNTNNVQNPGIRTENQLDMNKTIRLKSMEYYKTKAILGISSEYFIAFKKQSGNYLNINGSYGIGDSSVNATQTEIKLNNVPSKNLAQLTRITKYNQDIIKIEIYTWT